MSRAFSRLENQAKHLTSDEAQARELAEQSTLPDRGREADLKKPAHLTGAAASYWKSLLKRLDGLTLLDDLDAEMLAGYCAMLARRDALTRLHTKMTAHLARETGDDAVAMIDKLTGVASQLATLDRNIAAYADKLGLDPAGRVRLAQKRAAASLESDEDGDLFG